MEVKHDGHTISVSDIWFIAHHMKKLTTKTGITVSHWQQMQLNMSRWNVPPNPRVCYFAGMHKNKTKAVRSNGGSTH